MVILFLNFSFVRDPTEASVCYRFVGPSGEPVSRDVLDFAAEPVEIYWRVQHRGKQSLLRVNPGSIRRLT